MILVGALKPLPEKEAEMANDGLCPLYVGILGTLDSDVQVQNQYLKDHGIKSMQMAAITYHMARLGYILEKGIFKRKLTITEKGRNALQKYA